MSNLAKPSSASFVRDELAKIEQLRKELLRKLDDEVTKLPAALGLNSLQEVIDLLRTKNETGSVEAFVGSALPQRIESQVHEPHAMYGARRTSRRGKAIGPETTRRVEVALLGNEPGKDIAHRLGLSPSTVSGIRKRMVKEGRLPE